MNSVKTWLRRMLVSGAAATILVGASVAWSTTESTIETSDLHEVELAAYHEGFDSGDETLLITVHAQYGIACIDCHDQSNLDEWAVTDKDENGFVEDDDFVFDRYSCLVCHDDGDALTGRDLAEINESTILTGLVTAYNYDGLYNVHSNHRSEQSCSDCHHMHEKSVVSCTYCHELDAVPDGWEFTFEYCG